MGFKPSATSTVLLWSLAAAFTWLACWQWGRSDVKRVDLTRLANAPVVDTLPKPTNVEPFTRVKLTGQFDPDRHVLVDNRVYEGQTGVHVITLFTIEESGETLLVNRGWLPMRPDRSALPEVPMFSGTVSISGHLQQLRQPGAVLGDADQFEPNAWPLLWTYPDMKKLAKAYGIAAYPLVLYLDENSPGGFAGRQWQPYYMTPEKHRAYAVQWFALALTAVVAWCVLGRIRARSQTA